MEPIPQESGKAQPQTRLEIFFVPVILAVAVFFRLGDLSARNLWTDEAWVALAALAPTVAEALTLGRSTPPFYTLSLWGLAQAFGGSEAVLRSLSFAFGVGALILFWFAARRVVSPATSLLGLTLVAISPVLVYFSKELKQYSGDAFFAVLVVLLAEQVKNRPGLRPWLLLALVGPLALGFSHGAVFFLPAVLLVLWLETPSSQRMRLAGLAAFWAATMAGFFVLFYRRQIDPELVAYWAGDYPDFSGLIPFLLWFGGAWGRYFHYFFSPFFLPSWGWLWGAGFTALGILASIWHGSRRLLLYWAAPLALALVAASLHRYPFMGHYNGSRLFLFSAPWLYLLASLGFLSLLSRLWRQPHRWAAPALAVLVLVTTQPLALLQENLRPQANRQELKPLTNYLSTRLRPGDLIYVYYHAIFPFKYYFKGNTEEVLWGKSCGEKNLPLPMAHSQVPRRLWLVAAHFGSLASIKQFAAGLFGDSWTEKETVLGHNAALLLYVPRNRIELSPSNPRLKPRQSWTSPPPTGRACLEPPPPRTP
ncbi:MAG: glycosyltransferase family 39 protein [Desulfobaccales bacterium]